MPWTNTKEKSPSKRHLGSMLGSSILFIVPLPKSGNLVFRHIEAYWGIHHSSCGEGVLRQSCGRRHTRWANYTPSYPKSLLVAHYMPYQNLQKTWWSRLLAFEMHLNHMHSRFERIKSGNLQTGKHSVFEHVWTHWSPNRNLGGGKFHRCQNEFQERMRQSGLHWLKLAAFLVQTKLVFRKLPQISVISVICSAGNGIW